MYEKAKDGSLKSVNGSSAAASGAGDAASQPKKRRRWDQTADDTPAKQAKKASSWDAAEAGTPSNSRWDETPGRKPTGAETPSATPSTRIWDATPGHATPGAVTPGRDTPGHTTPGHQGTPSARKNRWDETPKTDRGKGFCKHLLKSLFRRGEMNKFA